MSLRKAELLAINNDNRPLDNKPADQVQFNPTSLRIQISNRTAGGQQAGAQARQRPGTGEMQVSFDLIFDTADEGGDVLQKTAIVERFVRPRGNQPGQEAPPRVQFSWGNFQVQGTMESANLDIDLFDSNGTPLRAKIAVTIKGQDPRWSYQPSSGTPAANTASNTLPPGTPGTKGSNRGKQQAAERVVQAMPGEDLVQLISRNGLSPAAWRTLADQTGNPFNLPLGQEIALPANPPAASANGSNGQGQDRAQLASSLANNERSSTHPVQQGQALASQGGVKNSLRAAQTSQHQKQASTRLQGFGMSARDNSENTDRPWGSGIPLRPRIGSQQSPPSRPVNSTALYQHPSTPPTRSTPAPTMRRGCGCSGRKK